MANTKVPAELSSTPGIIDNSTATAITIDSAGAATFSGDVGIGTSSPNSYAGQTTLNINSAGVARLDLDIGDTMQGFLLAESGYTGLFTPSGSNYLVFGTNNTERMRIDASGNLTLNTTNSTLNVGNGGFSQTNYGLLGLNGSNGGFIKMGTAGVEQGAVYANSGGLTFQTPATYAMTWYPAGAFAMKLDASGNLGIGQTPSATSAYMVALQVGEQGNLYGHTDGIGVGSAVYLSNNITHNDGNKYINSDTGSMYEQASGVHKWYSFPSGTAGAAATATERMRIDSSGNVGIGTNTPVTKLDVKGTFGAPDTTGSAGGFISRFAQSSGGGVLDVGFGDPYSWIQSRNSADYATQYGLSLNPNGGNVGIGVLAPPVKLTIDAPAADRETIRLATYYSPIDNLARGGISWHDGGAVTGQIDTRYTGTTVDMHLGHLYNLGYNTTSRVIIKGNGNVEIPDGNLSFAAGHGIDFSATANAGGTSNATSSEILDDYEEGTWYPYLGTETQLGSPASSNYNNFYVKVGRLVKCTGYFNQWNYANVTSGTYMMIRNLPFPPAHHDIGMRLGYASNIGNSTYAYGNAEVSGFYLMIGGSTGVGAHYTRAAAPTSGAAYAMITATYYTDS